MTAEGKQSSHYEAYNIDWVLKIAFHSIMGIHS
jgi:hypothetical protein